MFIHVFLWSASTPAGRMSTSPLPPGPGLGRPHRVSVAILDQIRKAISVVTLELSASQHALMERTPLFQAMDIIARERPPHVVSQNLDRFAYNVAAYANRLIADQRVPYHRSVSIKQLRSMIWEPEVLPSLEVLQRWLLAGGQSAPTFSATTVASSTPTPDAPPATVSPGPAATQPLVVDYEDLAGWAVVFPSVGDHYFWHRATNTTQWEPPTDAPPPPPLPEAARPVCPVCLDNLPQVAAQCGHAICEDCYQEVYHRRGGAACTVCRAPVAHWLRIFL